MNLYDILEKSANQATTIQAKDGSFPSGHNGPYIDEETPVRNTSHWLMVLLKVYEVTEDLKYLDSAKQALGYISSANARPMGATFWHRKSPEKDFSNGLIGQAWTIEALIEAYKHLGDKEILELAKEVFLIHPYDQTAGGWNIVNVDGSYADIDYTFNHQLWFAAIGSSLLQLGVNEVKPDLDDFIDRLDMRLKLYGNGLIRHISPNTFNTSLKKQLYRNILSVITLPGDKKRLRVKSIGYHAFNLYGFAILKANYPDHTFWNSDKLAKAISYLISNSYKKDIANNKYGYPYNPPGFEVAFTLETFIGDEEKENISKWLSAQINRCFDFNSHLMTKGTTKDPTTSAARIYESTRLKNYELNCESIDGVN